MGECTYDIYIHRGMRFRLSGKKCAELRKAAETARSLRNSYIAKCKDGQRRIAGFHRDVQNANLMVLREFDRVCATRGFVYMLYDGTLLGAMRHAGFIPWDDDVDVVMPREHYEKIVGVFNAESRIPSLRARLVSPSRRNVFIKIEAVEEPMICIDVFPFDCYADDLNEAVERRVRDLRQRLVGLVLPDKSPDTTYKHYAALRNKLGMTPVAHDDPECRSVVWPFDKPNCFFLDSKDVFPVRRLDFEGISMPVPANSVRILKDKYGKTANVFPLSMRTHIRCNKPTVERMLNVKRFLRSDPLRLVPLPRRRMDETERLRDRFQTCVRKLISPVFNIITRDTLKEYHLFSRRILRLRADRLLRSHMEAVEMYSRLIQDEIPAPLAGGLLRQSQTASAEALSGVLHVCEREELTVWLWLGSLLGAVRSGAFSHTDTEAVLLMPRADYERFRPLCNAHSDTTGLRAELAFRHGGVATVVAMEGKSRVVAIACDSCPDDWDRNIYARHMADAENKAAIESLKAKNDLDGLYRHHAALRERMGIGLDGDKCHSIFPGWDSPDLFEQCHVLPAKYYAPSVKMRFECLDVPVPADHDIVLTSLYGDYVFADCEPGHAMMSIR